MARVFIFAEHVKKLLDAGKREIEIPEGTRLSAAASDLIKDNKLQIKTVAPHGQPVPVAPPSDRKAVRGKVKTKQAGQVPTDTGKDESYSSVATENEITEELLNEIANRVVERIRRQKDLATESPKDKKRTSLESQSSPADDDDIIICRCEEINKGAIKDAIRNGMQTLNGIKRITRAGMGLCQGQTCQRLVSQILAEELGLSLADVEPTTARGPVRPLRLAVFANR